jgi:hypothetical protein
MKKMRNAVISLAIVLLSAPVIHGQDLSKYRTLSFDMSLAELSNRADLEPLQTTLIHKQPAVIQELLCRSRKPAGSALQADSVWQTSFIFYNGQLFQIFVSYDRDATEGLTAEDMVQAISVQYGTPTRPDAQMSLASSEQFRTTEKVIARWENTQYSVSLFRSKFLNTYGLVLVSKRLNEQAEVAIAASVKLEGQEDLRKKIDRQNTEAGILEVARQKNIKTFRP